MENTNKVSQSEEKTDFPKVSIVILNWNEWKDTIECLESVFQMNYPNYNVVVVDNGSTDKSVEKIKRYAHGELVPQSDLIKYSEDNKPIEILEYRWSNTEEKGHQNKLDLETFSNDKLILLKNEENLGYTGGNNRGIKFALEKFQPNFVVILNNDTVVDTEFLRKLIKHAQKKEKFGLLGPSILNYNQDSSSDHPALRLSFLPGFTSPHLNKVYTSEEKNVIRKALFKGGVVFLGGACLLLKPSVFREVDGFDERFFCYLDEIDLAARIVKRGYDLGAVEESKIWHKSHSSTGGPSEFSEIRSYYRIRNRILNFKKHGARLYLPLFYLHLFFIVVLSQLSKAFRDGNIRKGIITILSGIFDGITGKFGKRDDLHS